MINAVIIDDEQHCVDRLKNMLNADFSTSVQLSGCAQSVNEAIQLIANVKPDLIFLDVQIHDETGFDLLRKLQGFDFGIIFTTAYEKFAIQAIKFSAIDYLLKPVDKDDLHKALEKSSNEISKKTTAAKLDILLHNLERKSDSLKKIIVPTVTGFEFLNVADIIHCKSDINYTTIYLKENKKFIVAKTLKEFEEMLSEYNFFRVNNSHLINLACIKSYNKGKGAL